jgi:hypothetical protein
MKNLKKTLFIIACICACVSIVIVSTTYSKYKTSVSGTADIEIAKWNILINDITIKNHDDLSQVITPIFLGNDNINPDIIAPTAEGYFELNINYENSDLSFDYEITISPNENSSVTDLIATKYTIDGSEVELSGTNTITGEALNSDTTKEKRLVIYIKWDDENGEMDNAADTATTIDENAKALLDVSISCTQKSN